MGLENRNNFDFLRLFAAVMVLFSHHFALTGRPEPVFWASQTMGSLGVGIFFSVSGYLVTLSWIRDPSVKRFAARRMLRIWPGLIVAILFCVFVIGLLNTSMSFPAYIAHDATLGFLKQVVLVFQPFLPGVFEISPYKNSVNGSLWTIKYEVLCYVSFAIGVSLVRFPIRWGWVVWPLMLIFFFFVRDGGNSIGPGTKRAYLLEYGCLFSAGVFWCVLQEYWIEKKKLEHLKYAIAIVGVTLLYNKHPLLGISLSLPALTLLFGQASWPPLSDVGRNGDISYGVYLYAYPLQQLAIQITSPAGFTDSLIIGTAMTFFVALVSWRFVEKPALAFKPKVARHVRKV